MLTLRPPTSDLLADFLASQRDLPLTYAPEEMTRGTCPAGYNHDHRRVRLGTGIESFDRAVAALRQWAMFKQNWIQLYPADVPPQAGQVVEIVARIGPTWWMNACRVLYVIDEVTPHRRVGFAYGTLPGHAESGEERFSVELAHDGSVCYDLLAYSRPRHWLARLGYPLSRAMQRRFAAGSAAAMQRAAGDTGGDCQDDRSGSIESHV